MSLERGFKAWCERTATGVRRTLGLQEHERLDPQALAANLGVRLLTPHDIADLPPEDLDQLLHRDPSGWSAVTVTVGGRSIVIYNPKNSPGRTASDIAHELAHILLSHRPATLILSPDGHMVMRSFDAKQEDEANWLAWCLLLPRPALIRSAAQRLTIKQIAESFGVSEKLVAFRVAKTGVQLQIMRRGARWPIPGGNKLMTEAPPPRRPPTKPRGSGPAQ
jgi:hypothetical protein